jgi:catechol 2,3-dioxygenase-like lactoylglutathione lyase family enzyme
MSRFPLRRQDKTMELAEAEALLARMPTVTLRSVGSVGDSYDNALAETINGLFKTKVIRRRGPWRNLEAVEFDTLERVDCLNNRRLLEPTGNMPPAEAEARYYAARAHREDDPMPDHVAANLPARDLDETAAFYAWLGFGVEYRSADWMVLRRDALELEFFLHPDLEPASSWHNASVWVADLDALHRAWAAGELPPEGAPRLTEPAYLPSGYRMFALVDPNGSLLRCLQLRSPAR